MIEIPGLSSKGTGLHHIAINTGEIGKLSTEKQIEEETASKNSIEKLHKLLDMQIRQDHRIMSISFPEEKTSIKTTLDFLKEIIDDKKINDNQIRILVIGKWYELDSEKREFLKEVMEKTKSYDKFFLNICINYDGQEEILGSVRLMIRKILAGKMKEEDLDFEHIKDNTYNSYFPPPEIIVEPGSAYSGLLMWHSKGARIKFLDKNWLDMEVKEVEDAIAKLEKR
jgi:undecaprenyl diphosphate synthase